MRLQHVEIKLSDGRVGFFTGREFVHRELPALTVVGVTFHDPVDVEGITLPEDKAVPVKPVPTDMATAFAQAVEEIRAEHAQAKKVPAKKKSKHRPRRPKA